MYVAIAHRADLADLGLNSSTIQIPFLNHIAQLAARSRSNILIRVGGSSADQALYDPAQTISVLNTTATNITVGPELFRVLKSISSSVGTSFVYGLNLFNTSSTRAMAIRAENALGSRILTYELGNEPDLEDPSIRSYISDFGKGLTLLNSSSTLPRKNIYGAPAFSGKFSTASLISAVCSSRSAPAHRAGLSQGLFEVAQRVRPSSIRLQQLRCRQWVRPSNRSSGRPAVVCVQPSLDRLTTDLNHTAATFPLDRFASTLQSLASIRLPAWLSETNSASCGGFPGMWLPENLL